MSNKILMDDSIILVTTDSTNKDIHVPFQDIYTINGIESIVKKITDKNLKDLILDIRNVTAERQWEKIDQLIKSLQKTHQLRHIGFVSIDSESEISKNYIGKLIESRNINVSFRGDNKNKNEQIFLQEFQNKEIALRITKGTASANDLSNDGIDHIIDLAAVYMGTTRNEAEKQVTDIINELKEIALIKIARAEKKLNSIGISTSTFANKASLGFQSQMAQGI